MDQELLLKTIPTDKFDLLTKEEVIDLYKASEDLLKQIIQHNNELTAKLLQGEQKKFLLGVQLINI
jgi:hypothetical protein